MYSARFQAFQRDLHERQLPITPPIFDESLVDRPLPVNRTGAYQSLLVLGIGGSTLGFRAIIHALRGPLYNAFRKGEIGVFVVDNVDPAVTGTLLAELDLKETLIVYITKSGSTPEPAANFLVFLEAHRAAGGGSQDLLLICDRAKYGINEIARKLGVQIFFIPDDLSGRFSVLSNVGIVPSRLTAIDASGLMEGARCMHAQAATSPPEENPCFLLGSLLHANFHQARNIHFVFSYSNLLSEFNLWLVQLWSESLGKKYDLQGKVVHAGVTPVCGIGATDQHSILQLLKEGPRDKVVGFVKVTEFDDPVPIPKLFPELVEYSYFGGHSLAEQLNVEQISTEISLSRSGVPCYTLAVDKLDAVALGCLFYFWELVTIYYARLEGINPFDQPGVEEGKKMTYALMGREDFSNVREAQEELLNDYRARERVVCVEYGGAE
jgi:glucose-6-phosphate isomerase